MLHLSFRIRYVRTYNEGTRSIELIANWLDNRHMEKGAPCKCKGAFWSSGIFLQDYHFFLLLYFLLYKAISMFHVVRPVISCLSSRAPRSTCSLFGLTWHLANSFQISVMCNAYASSYSQFPDYFIGSVTFVWPLKYVSWSVGWSVSHNFLKGREVTLPCS